MAGVLHRQSQGDKGKGFITGMHFAMAVCMSQQPALNASSVDSGYSIYYISIYDLIVKS